MKKESYYQTTKSYYDRIGNLWGLYTDDNYSIESFKYGEDHIGEIARRANITDNKLAVLDCGCGFGKVISELQKRFPSNKYSGITLNDSHVKRKQHENVRVGNFECLEEENNSVDVVLFIESFNHAQDKSKVLEEVFRIMKNDGTLFILDQCVSNELYSSLPCELYNKHRDFYGATPVSPNYIIQEAKKVGFTVTHVEEDVKNNILPGTDERLKKFIIVEFLNTIYSEIICLKPS